MAEKVLIDPAELEKIVGKSVSKEVEKIFKENPGETEEVKKAREEKWETFTKKVEEDNVKKINELVAEKLAVRKTQEVSNLTDTTDQVLKSVDGTINIIKSRHGIEHIIQKTKMFDPHVIQTDWEKDLRYYSDRATILKALLSRKNLEGTIGNYGMYHEFIRHIEKAGTQWDRTTNDGLELIPTVLSSTILEDVLALGNLFSIIPRQTVPKNFEMARLDDQMKFFTVGDLVAPTKSTPATKKAIFNAQKIIGHAPISYEQDQDSIVASVALLMSALPKNLDGAIEEVIISGDNQTVHQDADIEAVATASARAFDGLRRIALDNTWTTTVTGNFVANTLRDMQAPLTARSGFSFENLFFIFGQNVMTQARQLASVRTQDAFGNQATNLGRLAMLDGSNVLGSEFMREDLNSAGVNATTTAGATKAACILFDRRHFMIGQIAPVLIETDRTITSQQIDLVLSLRLDMQQVLSTAKRPMTYAVDITKV